MRHRKTTTKKGKGSRLYPNAQPMLRQRGEILQTYGQVVSYDIGLRAKTRRRSVEMLNQILADTIILRDLYKKAHWQVSGPTFYQLHLLFQQHYEEQAKLTDMIAERAQTLGGLSRAVTADVVATTNVERAPSDRAQVPELLSRLIEAHKVVILQLREAAVRTARRNDLGTADLLVTDVLRTNEKQVWFLSEHLVNGPEVRAIGEKNEKKDRKRARKLQKRERRVLLRGKLRRGKVRRGEKGARREEKSTHRGRKSTHREEKSTHRGRKSTHREEKGGNLRH